MSSELVLSTEEKGDLGSLEATIDSGLGTFIEVGRALGVIRDRLLYREHADTFEDYVRDRFDMSRSYALKNIAGSQVAALLSPIVHIPPPTRESQVRPLVKLRDEQAQRTVWALAYRAAPKVNGEPSVTASIVEAEIAKLSLDEPQKNGQVRKQQTRKRHWRAEARNRGRRRKSVRLPNLELVEPHKDGSTYETPLLEAAARSKKLLGLLDKSSFEVSCIDCLNEIRGLVDVMNTLIMDASPSVTPAEIIGDIKALQKTVADSGFGDEASRKTCIAGLRQSRTFVKNAAQYLNEDGTPKEAKKCRK